MSVLLPLGLLGKLERRLQNNVAPRAKIVGRDVYWDIRSDADAFKVRAVRKGVMDGGDIENHAVVEGDVAGEGESSRGGFTHQCGALGVFEWHDEIFTGAGTDAIGEEDQSAGVGSVEGVDDGVAGGDRVSLRLHQFRRPGRHAEG